MLCIIYLNMDVNGHMNQKQENREVAMIGTRLPHMAAAVAAKWAVRGGLFLSSQSAQLGCPNKLANIFLNR